MARQTQDREWFLQLDGGAAYADDEELVAQALGECMTILTRLGGGIVIGANRQEIGLDIWETVGLSFKWTSFMPGVRYRDEEPVVQQGPDPEPELEPAA